jgi:hypothetical protein
VEAHCTKRRRDRLPCDPRSLERGVRQVLADKIAGNLVGLWLLVPEHLRLGTWDLLRGWTGRPGESVEPRLAMQLVHEAALCVTGIREQRSLGQKGFEVVNGLPFLATDQGVHELLNEHTIHEAKRLQIALGQIRRSRGHFRGELLGVDPHRLVSYSRREMRKRKAHPKARPTKMAQTFFCLDVETTQPVCFTLGSAARTVAKATPELLGMAAQVLAPQSDRALVLADSEHFTINLIERIQEHPRFDLLVPMPKQPYFRKRFEAIPDDQFKPRWAGLATAKVPHTLVHSQAAPLCMMVQRFGERPEEYGFSSFVCTADRDEVDALTLHYPKRWHVEEFFNANQALGWKRAGTQNLNIRYGRMTMALIAQAAIHQLRQRLDEETAGWDAEHLASDFLRGLEGDIRVWGDTIIVTFYNAPKAEHLRGQFAALPERLSREGVDPRIPWLYDLKLDFRFK